MYRTLRTVGAAAGDRAVAARGAAVAVDRGDADQGGDPAAVDAAELGQLGDQGAGGDLADARHRGQQVLGRPPGRASRVTWSSISWSSSAKRRLERRERRARCR